MKLKNLIKEYGEYEVKDEFKDMLIEPVSESETVWDLKEGDRYYYISADGTIDYYIWDNDSMDNKYRDSGNCFLTFAAAEHKLERRKIENKLITLGGRTKFKVNSNNFYINFNHMMNFVTVHNHSELDMGNIYFDTGEQCIKAIKVIGEERLEKYWFDIEEV